MANVVATIKMMPSSPDVNLEEVTAKAKKKISDFAGEGDVKVEEQPVAFGLKSLNITFVMDESKGSTEILEDELKDIEGVQSVQTTDVRRAVG
ncbi:elongation factor 1-beta [Candidatus Woesearchaeota archaeon]|nr:elongation factor 1-beta [Candidatus Woesearchaeota archaeon]